MKDFLMWLIVIIAAITLLIYITGEAADKQTTRLYARAHLVEAQSSARQDLLAGLMPYAILGLATTGGVVTVIAMTYGLVAFATIWVNRPPPPETVILERQIVVMLQPGQTHREFWQQANKVKLLEKR